MKSITYKALYFLDVYNQLSKLFVLQLREV